MANLRVTFTRSATDRAVAVPVAVGSVARYEDIEIPSASAGPNVSTNAAEGAESVAVLYAEADCVVAIGADPDAEGDALHFIPASTFREFALATGDKVAVIEA